MILAISTSTPRFSAAVLFEDGTVPAEFSAGLGRRHFLGFMPAVDHVLTASRVLPSDLRAIVVDTGPGSFTGLRVGIAAAKGMAHRLGIPVIGISSLAALARRIPVSGLPICALLDSRRGEVFCGLFESSCTARMKRLREDACVREVDLPQIVSTPTVVIGNDFSRQIPVIRRTLGDLALPAPPEFWHPSAAAAGALGLERYLRGETDSLHDLVPVYIRPPDIRPGPVQKTPSPNDPRF